jgi:membrane fusion protein (multidrug efflux system)
VATPFPQTLRALDAETRRRLSPRLFGIVALGACAAAWLTRAEVPVYVFSPSARLEVDQRAHRVASPEPGRVTHVSLALGREVARDEVLIELDSSVELRTLDETEARVRALAPRLEVLKQQVEVEEQVRKWQLRVDEANVGRASVDLAQTALSAARDEELGRISARLRDQQLSSTVDDIRAQADAKAGQLRAEASRVGVDLSRRAMRLAEEKQRARIEELRRQIADTEGEREMARAAAETARAQIERRRIRAPEAGRLGNIAPLQVGEVLKVGDFVATVVPGDEIHAVAELTPADAAGRVAPGQRARIRLDGFAWTDFGILEARVTRVGSEPAGGRIRVELRVDPSTAPRISLEHGLPGTAEIEVERSSPWSLLVRGLAWDAGSTAPAAAAPAVPTASGRGTP